MSNAQNDYTNKTSKTNIYRKIGEQEELIGFVGEDAIIYKVRWDNVIRVGRVSTDHRIFRDTRYDERELGSFTDIGIVHSHGLFEGGELGWVEKDGVVIQAGLIFGEEEIGRVEGNAQNAAGAALLLLFFADEQEETNRANR